MLIEAQAVQIFKACILPISIDDIVTAVNEKFRLRSITADVTVIAEVLGVMDRVEKRADGLYQTTFARLNHAQRAHRVLYENNEPMTIHEIVDAINQQLAVAGRLPATAKHIANQLSSYPAIVAIGKSGWALAEWGGETRSVLKIMEEFFHPRNQSAKTDEVFAYVRDRRPVKRTSVAAYLASDNIFRRIGPDEYVMASWQSAEYSIPYKGATRRRIPQADFDTAILNVFRAQSAEVLPFAQLTAALRQSLRCCDMSARVHIKSSSVVRIARPKNGICLNVALRDSDFNRSDAGSDGPAII